MRKEIIDLLPCDKQDGFYVVPGIERFSVNGGTWRNKIKISYFNSLEKVLLDSNI